MSKNFSTGKFKNTLRTSAGVAHQNLLDAPNSNHSTVILNLTRTLLTELYPNDLSHSQNTPNLTFGGTSVVRCVRGGLTQMRGRPG